MEPAWRFGCLTVWWPEQTAPRSPLQGWEGLRRLFEGSLSKAVLRGKRSLKVQSLIFQSQRGPTGFPVYPLDFWMSTHRMCKKTTHSADNVGTPHVSATAGLLWTEVRKDQTPHESTHMNTSSTSGTPSSVDLGNACPGSRFQLGLMTKSTSLVHDMQRGSPVGSVCLGHHSKVPQTGASTTGMYCFTALGPGSPSSRCWQVWLFLRPPSPCPLSVLARPFLGASSSLVCPLTLGLYPLTSFNLNYLLKGPTFKYSHSRG